MTFKIRSATADDTAALTELLNAIIGAGGTTAIETPLSRDAFDDAFVSGARVLCCHVAVDTATREALGFQALERSADPSSARVDIATFARLQPKVPGVGTALFTATVQKARALGVAAIVAQIRADNRGGLAYYEKMGFRTFAKIPSVALQDGTPIDRILKRLDLR